MAAVDPSVIFKDNLFQGKVLLCSGGGSGICRSITETMVRLGAKAVIFSRTKDKLELAAKEMSQLTGGEIHAVAGDVRKVEDTERVVEETIKRFGRLDFLINGAAGNFLSPFENLSYNAFRTVIEIDLLGTFNLTKSAIKHIKETKGSIINITATLHYIGTPYQQHVGAAKAGIDALTKHWAVELGPLGVRVNAIAPGPVASTVGVKRLNLGSFLQDEHIPLQRFGDVRDVSNASVFLFSQAASWVTGAIFVVDGGQWMNPCYPAYPEMVKNPPDFKL